MSLLRHKAFFTLALLLFMLAVLAATPHLGRIARLVPLLVIVPTLALLALTLVGDLVPRFRRINEGMERARWLPLPKREAREDRDRGSEQAAPLAGGALGRLVWTLCLPVLIYGLGFCVGIPVHALVYLRRFSKERWLLSLAIPAGLGGLMLLLPRLVPAVSLWPGWIWVRLGLR
jgi:hypothetical protein